MDVKEKLVELIAKAKEIYAGDYTDHTEDEYIAEMLLDNGVTVQGDELPTNCKQLWIPVSEPPTEYRDKYGELIPFLVCLEGTEYPFRAMYDGKVWGDGFGVIPVKYWMPLPEPQKEDNNENNL